MKPHYLKEELDLTKDIALNKVLITIISVMAFAIIVSLTRIPQTGFTIHYGLHLLIGASMIVLYAIRRKLKTKVKGILFLLILSSMAISGLITFGLYSFAYAYFIPAIAISFLFFNRKTGWFFTVLCFVFILITAFLFNRQILNFTAEQGFMQSTPMWLNMVTTITLVSIAMTMFWNNMYSMLINSFTHINKQKEDIKKINADLIKARDKAQESDQLKTYFLQNISHEIRTPLNIIIGFSDMLSQTNDPEEKQQYNKVIWENSDNMLKLINDIVDFSKIETNSFKLHPTRFNIQDVLKNLKEKYLYNLNKKDITITISTAHYEINTDKERFEQIITNLIDNAVKFTNSGEINLKISEQNHFLHFIVTDTGIGISKEDQEKIFDRFFKIDPFKNGAGLGLSISKSIASYMGGDISVHSTPREGSIFDFKIPL
jgi:signal transduction histidine kinase